MDVKNIKLSELITKPITVNPNSTLLKTRESLLKNKVKRVVIVDKKIPVGVITEKDIAKKIYELGSKPIKSVKAKDFIPKKLFTLTRDNSVQECAKLMKKHRISLVIITNKDNTLGGIVTETDLVKAFLTKESTSFKVSKIMKKELITAAPSDPILHVESLLLKYGISRVIIKRNQIPVGIITFRDFVPAKIPQWIAESADPKEVQEYKFKKGLEEIHSNQMSYLFPFHATDIMTVKPITIDMDEDIKTAITLMVKHNISGLPVVKKSKLVGIVTKSDVVAALAE
ncbi:inosine-5-monophosphate dehydrogenase [Nitrosopumilus zosterae]|uniref:Inosine-5-monophosphate dehydrogenase n=1 Tax=Nitrosopumilus zosterae TaxID=718286 RepID=A0A2S2KP68_9ARCH|nr:CBS domain-containing protein [Nitrosopumilus zosterae]BDQ31219.1 CBS domain-containing protein [Nitrosopumilus zosterae]GBH33429.1 inosine-5-monophosphate dehydrogenase [Nitrosopumilus zosterae]